jgi:tetratricopeptide (TPR) repeat protein
VQRIIKNVRLRSGEQLARWQLVKDSGDHAALVEFSTNPSVLTLGPELICALGRDLVAAGRLPARLELLRQAVERYPTHVWINFDLMHACKNAGQNIEAIHYGCVALAARPDSTLILVNLGQHLLDAGAYHHAARVFQKALTLAPTYVDAIRGLITALNLIGDRSAALDAQRALVRVSPKYIQARIDLGVALSGMDDLDGAIVEFKEAIRLQPSLHIAHYRLGQVYEKLGAYAEAAASYRTAVKYLPTADGYKRALSNIGRLQHIVKRLPAMKQGAEYPATSADMAAMAGVCCTQRQKEYALAVRLYTDAFDTDPRLAAAPASHRYNAACAAIRLAAGDDVDGPIDADEASFHRNRAWEWLAADLARYRPFATSAQSESRRWASDRIGPWMTDPDLDSVRDAKRRESLPQDERLLWDRFWAEVETISKPIKSVSNAPFGKLPGP